MKASISVGILKVRCSRPDNVSQYFAVGVKSNTTAVPNNPHGYITGCWQYVKRFVNSVPAVWIIK